MGPKIASRFIRRIRHNLWDDPGYLQKFGLKPMWSDAELLDVLQEAIVRISMAIKERPGLRYFFAVLDFTFLLAIYRMETQWEEVEGGFLFNGRLIPLGDVHPVFEAPAERARQRTLVKYPSIRLPEHSDLLIEGELRRRWLM